MIEFRKGISQREFAVEQGDRVVVNGVEYFVTDFLGENDVSGSRAFRAANVDDPENCILLKDKKERDTFGLDYTLHTRKSLPIDEESLSSYIDYNPYREGRVVIAGSFTDGVSFDRLDIGEPYTRENILKVVCLTRGMIKAVGKLMEVGALHRDVKARNAMFLRNGGVGLIDIDFLTRLQNEIERLEREKTEALQKGGKWKPTSIGTPETMSPESVVGRFSNTSDMYSLGVVALGQLGKPVDQEIGSPFERMREDDKKGRIDKLRNVFFPKDMEGRMMTNVLPNYHESVMQQARGLIRFILQATQHDPTNRPQSGEEAMKILDSGL